SYSETPKIENRGLWTWGYVIYDYRRYIDNMAKLKMNMLTIWNDCVPLNIGEVIAYAKSRGIKTVLGFHWGWGLKGLELGRAEDRNTIKNMVLTEYERSYSKLDIDGIYFQTLTEIRETQTAGMSIASAATELVNATSAELLNRYPGLDIQFGLHAISILDNYRELAELDPRVTITWEDAGVIPYAYDPVIFPSGWMQANGLDTFERTLEYSLKLAALRPNTRFAMVPKGFICLRWGSEFENHGDFILGERDRDFIKNRLIERQPRWDEVNKLWLENCPLASRFYREMLTCNPANMTVTALVEDGMFEEKIQSSVSLLGETLWNPYRSDTELLARAASPYLR
ncbi:MAG: hypothetical protein GX811_02290, partial [Lentisphaerae bacterium]|nr:hypothetical protein [Lentisphaerota bacterium]